MTQPVVVLAGGLGTRIARFANDLPKAMLPVAGRPFIDHKLLGLAEQGADRVVLLVGSGADLIEEHVGSGEGYGLSVTCVRDGPQLLGTGGSIAAALKLLPETFWVTYGDTLLRAPLAEVEQSFEDGSAVMTVFANHDLWETSNVSIADGKVIAYDKRAQANTHTHIDYGMLLMRDVAFAGRQLGEAFDLAEVLEGMVRTMELLAFEVIDRFYDVGTEERYAETCLAVEGDALWSTP